MLNTVALPAVRILVRIVKTTLIVAGIFLVFMAFTEFHSYGNPDISKYGFIPLFNHFNVPPFHKVAR